MTNVTESCSSFDCRSSDCNGCTNYGDSCYVVDAFTSSCGQVWSSTFGELGYWTIDFRTASVDVVPEGFSAKTLCVRGDSPGGDCESSAFSTSYSVGASSGYYTGYQICAGQQLNFEASGSWCWGGSYDCSDANGTSGRPLPGETPVFNPGSYMGALVGRIGSTTFHIGSYTSIAAPASGELELWMNDNLSSYGDNSGSLSVYVNAQSYY